MGWNLGAPSPLPGSYPATRVPLSVQQAIASTFLALVANSWGKKILNHV